MVRLIKTTVVTVFCLLQAGLTLCSPIINITDVDSTAHHMKRDPVKFGLAPKTLAPKAATMAQQDHISNGPFAYCNVDHHTKRTQVNLWFKNFDLEKNRVGGMESEFSKLLKKNCGDKKAGNPGVWITAMQEDMGWDWHFVATFSAHFPAVCLDEQLKRIGTTNWKGLCGPKGPPQHGWSSLIESD